MCVKMPSCASDWRTRLLLPAPRINLSPCGNKCWNRWDSCMFAVRSPGWSGMGICDPIPSLFPFVIFSPFVCATYRRGRLWNTCQPIYSFCFCRCTRGFLSLRYPSSWFWWALCCQIIPAVSLQTQTPTTFSSLVTTVFHIQMFPSPLSCGLYLRFQYSKHILQCTFFVKYEYLQL